MNEQGVPHEYVPATVFCGVLQVDASRFVDVALARQATGMFSDLGQPTMRVFRGFSQRDGEYVGSVPAYISLEAFGAMFGGGDYFVQLIDGGGRVRLARPLDFGFEGPPRPRASTAGAPTPPLARRMARRVRGPAVLVFKDGIYLDTMDPSAGHFEIRVRFGQGRYWLRYVDVGGRIRGGCELAEIS